MQRQQAAIRILLGAASILFFSAGSSFAQEGSGPITPPPEHEVRRVTPNTATPEAPPDLPPAEIVKQFSRKEDEFIAARGKFGFRRTIRLTEYGLDGKPAGEFSLVTDTTVTPDGRGYEKTVDRDESTLHFMKIQPENLNALKRLPAYPLTSSQLARYILRYVGREKVDEVDCYIFEIKPKTVERDKPAFQGVVWVDTKFLEIVKTYGKYVTDLGDFHLADLPFANFEIYRENVEGKYWFPNYARSDDIFVFKDLTTETKVPVRMVIKWEEFKPASAEPAASPVAPQNDSQPSTAPAPPKP